MKHLVLFDLDGTLVDHESAAAEGVERWLMAQGWADVGSIAGLVSDWDAIAERHFPAYRARLTTFQGQRRLRLRDFLPRGKRSLLTRAGVLESRQLMCDRWPRDLRCRSAVGFFKARPRLWFGS